MKRIFAAVTVAASIVSIAACGSTTTKTQVITKTVAAAPSSTSSTTTPTTTPTTTVASTTTTSTTSSGPPECDTMGKREGYCVDSGKQYQVANSDGIVHLKSMSVKLNGVKSADSLSGDGGYETATAHGRFLIFDVTITNRDDSGQSFGDGLGGQSVLGVGDGSHFKSYDEDFNAENGPDAGSCIDANNSEAIQPGESATCDVVFDVPPPVVAQIPTSGNLDFVNFGVDLSFGGSTGTVGVFRLESPAVTIAAS